MTLVFCYKIRLLIINILQIKQIKSEIQMEVIIHQFDLQLRHTFTIARESYAVQPTLIVELKDGNYSGFGEATTNPYYGVTLANLEIAIDKIRHKLIDYQLITPEELWQDLHEDLQNTPFALCALNNASYDLFGKIHQKPVYEIWGLNPKHIPLTNYTIGIDTIPKMIAKMQEKPWNLYKIKLGTPHDIEIIQKLRQHTESRFRVDANCAWDAETTLKNAEALQKLGVEFIEQPLKADDWAGMKEVFRHSALPIIADESCIREADVQRCADFFHGINIKLTKCGGLTPAYRMIQKAKDLGLKTMVGCMTESLVGISAIAHLAPLLDYVDMDGAMLLKTQIASGVEITPNGVNFPKTNGLGIELLQ